MNEETWMGTMAERLVQYLLSPFYASKRLPPVSDRSVDKPVGSYCWWGRVQSAQAYVALVGEPPVQQDKAFPSFCLSKFTMIRATF